ncbi:MAG: hypothetical protein ABJO36_13240 [Litorimonas sp.]
MKTRYTIAIVGAPLILLAGFFFWLYWISIAFEHRENYNGVGYNAFRKSIIHHVKQGPNRLSDMRSYEGTWWFTLRDQTSHSYSVTLGRDAFVDARQMSTLKYGRFVLNQIAGQELLCENNYGESKSVLLELENLGVSEHQPSSMNALLVGISRQVTNFGETLPMSFEIDGNQLEGFPDWLQIDIERHSSDCGDDNKLLEPPTFITCRLIQP